ncbi:MULTISPECIES: hypothetical protein [Pseudonocardia]|uniref:Uncharacterized protein n=2 Tax=Pseudonocardia TaxID=1847 RepID=A0A1Y2MS85_PSEAH|nr:MULTISPECIES: hypothetical protein [Pseudonocardia]OSY38080.1 hypothetical protein BG845_04253 [Pseudonocardia autotrophica]TDN75521.1 hypothetical protein C8E95_4698 [Pseudonocardia autotrophica]BBF99490.1 hypothetical protein Pdca_07000 [Pseudonocardia autotrophica]GEC28491.1 hypothetical protein PSA01_55200 [Pseudonocardia saturnea]
MFLRTALTWHRPLMIVGLACAALVPLGLLGILADPRVLLGAPIWLKPTKFAVSIAIFCVTWAWLYAQLREQRGRARVAFLAGTVAAITLAIEMVVIAVQAGRGTTSHFNVTTTLNTTLWSVMGISIVVAWLATLWLTGALFGLRDLDPARSLAIRAGALIAVAGMALGFLMTSPTPDQLADFQGIAGAHTVGLPDGGPGLAVVGWSTVGGDLRIPHFVGMHALQILPLLLICLELAAPRVAVLADPRVRRDLVATATAGYLGLLALLTWQALRGQPLLAPDAWTAAAFGAVVVAVGAGSVLALRRRTVPVSRTGAGGH